MTQCKSIEDAKKWAENWLCRISINNFGTEHSFPINNVDARTLICLNALFFRKFIPFDYIPGKAANAGIIQRCEMLQLLVPKRYSVFFFDYFIEISDYFSILLNGKTLLKDLKVFELSEKSTFDPTKEGCSIINSRSNYYDCFDDKLRNEMIKEFDLFVFKSNIFSTTIIAKYILNLISIIQKND